MKKKKVIGIDLNETVRAYWYSFEEMYVKHMKELSEPIYVTKPFQNYELLDHFGFPEKIVDVRYLKAHIPDDIPQADYILDKTTGTSKADPLLFDIVKELRTPQQRLDKFMYEDYLWELHGNCGKVYELVVNDIHKLYDKYKNDFDFLIVSLESHRSIIPTMFFISKCGFQLPHYFFGGKPETIWDRVDILISANPKMIQSVPKGKDVIHVFREFNKEIPCPHYRMWIDNISDFHVDDPYHLKDLNKFNRKITLIHKFKNYIHNLFNKSKNE